MNAATLSTAFCLTAAVVATGLATSCSSGSEFPCPPPSNKILVDASHDGGVWWAPQGGPFVADSAHQGKALADYLRSKGYAVDELGQHALVAAFLPKYSKVIRVGSYGRYSVDELPTYLAFASCPVTILLLEDFLDPDREDPLAAALGIAFRGSFSGNITRFADHPITSGVTRMPFIAGAAVDLSASQSVQALGWLDDGRPVMGVASNQRARIFFIGDTNGIEAVPQPLVDNLVAWGF
jgi:hypothetical protein